MLKIIPNPNRNIYESETRAVKESGGYCPCRLVHNQDTKCMCKDFKEQKTAGLCYCERFMKVEV